MIHDKGTFPRRVGFISRARHTENGFSTIELLVTIAIFALTSGIILSSFPRFASKSATLNLAYEVALAVREAQVFGIAVREVGTGVFPSHGVYFKGAEKDRFQLFADINNDSVYNSGEQIDTFILGRGYTYGVLRGYVSVGVPYSKIEDLHITFKRPDPEAKIIGDTQPGFGVNLVTFSYVEIPIVPLRGDPKTVVVWSSGQIAVK